MKKDKPPASVAATPRELRRLPFGDHAAVHPGEPVHFLAWYCADDTSSLQSAVRQHAGEIWTFSPYEVERSGPCVKVSAIVDTDRLPAGAYDYEISSGTETRTGTSFEVITRQTP
jgi:hypothetical protein